MKPAIAIFAAWLIGAAVLAQAGDPVDMNALLQQALDQPVQFEVTNKPLPEAFVIIADETGVPMHIEEDTLALLPYGANTTMSAKMTSLPLRAGLDQLLNPIGMTYRIANERVVVEAAEPLKRIGRPASWSELKTLEWLADTGWESIQPDANELGNRLQFRVDSPDPWTQLKTSMQRVGAGTVGDVLTIAGEKLGWVWYPRNDKIVILAAEGQVKRDLQKKITIHADHKPIVDVIAELAEQSGIPMTIQPGAVATLPSDARNSFLLVLERAPVERGLEAIRATGLDYRFTEDGLEWFTTLPPREEDGDPIVVIVVLTTDDGEVQVLIRESELPPDLRDVRQSVVEEFIAHARRQLEDDPPKQ
jgi:hypothetical protein